MRSSAPLYDALAGEYERHFAAPHRRAYDQLAWEASVAAIGSAPKLIVDVGCGVGRWASLLVAAGHTVIGVEPAPAMAARARARLAAAPFTLVEAPVETADLPLSGADAIVAMGSLQYAADPVAAIARCAGWLRPGGVLCVLVDSRQALVLELIAAGRTDEALERLTTRRGVWTVGEHAADMHLLDAAELTAAARAAGLTVDRIAGLLVGASAHGRAELHRRLTADYETALATERRLAAEPALADLGKQLLLLAHRPT